MSLPFLASPPRPCIVRSIERVLGGPGIHLAVPREPCHYCPTPFSERRWGKAQQKGEFPPFVGSICIVADSIESPCLSESQPARIYLLEGLEWNIASCCHGFSLDLYVSCGCSRLFLLSNWMFPSAPTHMDVLICSYLSNWKFPFAPTRPASLRSPAPNPACSPCLGGLRKPLLGPFLILGCLCGSLRSWFGGF